MQVYDLVVIGSGAGLVLLDRALAAGQRCALVERGAFGGTCLNRGCIPTKVLCSAANLAHESKRAAKLGVEIDGVRLNWDRISQRVWQAIGENQEVASYYEKQANCDVYRASASFCEDASLTLKSSQGEDMGRIFGRRILIATGSRTRVHEVPGLNLDDPRVWTSESLFGKHWPKTLPKRLLILGGGPIACEFAHVFCEAGVEVTLVQRNVRLLPKEEALFSEQLQQSFLQRGIQVRLGTVLERVEDLSANQDSAGETGLRVHLKERQGEARHELLCDAILLATGVEPQQGLEPEKAGILCDEAGYIKTNAFCETSLPGVWALGDCRGGHPFRHVANQEGLLLADNLYPYPAGSSQATVRASLPCLEPPVQADLDEGKNQPAEVLAKANNGGDVIQSIEGLNLPPLRWMRYDNYPVVTYCWPELAHVGWLEHELQERSWTYTVAERRYHENAKGMALGYSADDVDDGWIRLYIADGQDGCWQAGTLLGVHIMGAEASVLLQPFLLAMTQFLPNRYRAEEEEIPLSPLAQKHVEASIEEAPPKTAVSAILNTVTPHPALPEITFWAMSELGGELRYVQQR